MNLWLQSHYSFPSLRTVTFKMFNVSLRGIVGMGAINPLPCSFFCFIFHLKHCPILDLEQFLVRKREREGERKTEAEMAVSWPSCLNIKRMDSGDTENTIFFSYGFASKSKWQWSGQQNQIYSLKAPHTVSTLVPTFSADFSCVFVFCLSLNSSYFLLMYAVKILSASLSF